MRQVFLGLFLFPTLLFLTLLGQSANRMETAYNNYIKTGDENHLRFQLINEINQQDFLQGADFLKKQRNQRAEQIMVEILQSYERYDLLEQILFTSPGDQVYRVRYKDIYYLTLLNNFKSRELLRIVIKEIDAIDQQVSKLKNPPHNDEIYSRMAVELYFLQTIAAKGERQLSDFEEVIRTYPFSEPKERKRDILFNHFYSGLDKKAFLKKVYESLIAPPKLVMEKTPEPAPEPAASQNTESLNSSEGFFDLDSLEAGGDASAKEMEQGAPTPSDPAGRGYGVIDEITKDGFLNGLYQRGYYLSYLHLFKTLGVRMGLSSPSYRRFVQKHRERFYRALTYAKQGAVDFGVDTVPAEEFDLQRLFYNNAYSKILASYKNQQQSDFYLLSLVATGSWDTLFPIVQGDPILAEEYRMIYLLGRNPDTLLVEMKSRPTEKLRAWQLDFLNLAEEKVDPKMISPVMMAVLLKNQKFLASRKPEATILYEYGVSSLAQIYWEIGKLTEVSRIFRENYNRLQMPAFKEKLMFLHGMATLIQDSAEGEKVLYQLLSINPQSHYRFDIEEALNSLL